MMRMSMFPFEMVGSVEIGQCSEEQMPALLSALVAALDRERANHIERTDDTVFFRAGMFRFVSKSNLLVTVTKGSIQIRTGKRGRLHYYFSCMQMLIFSLLVFALIAGFALQDKPISARILQALGVACLYFGLNYVSGLMRLRKFLRQIAKEKGHVQV